MKETRFRQAMKFWFQALKKLKAEIIYRGDDLSRVVTDIKVLAMTPENALGYMKGREGSLLTRSATLSRLTWWKTVPI